MPLRYAARSRERTAYLVMVLVEQEDGSVAVGVRLVGPGDVDTEVLGLDLGQLG